MVLTGLMKQEGFREFLAGPSLGIEVHDQDRKPSQPVAFGPSSGFKQEAGSSAHFGVAHLSLSELLTDQRKLEVQLQIRRCPPPQRMGAADTQALPPGDYVGANSTLKVRLVNLPGEQELGFGIW